MTDLNEKALKPCPFCGKDAQIAPDEIGSGGQHVPPYHAGCLRGAGCGIAFTADDPDEAIAEWNRRALSTATPPDVAGLIDELADEADLCRNETATDIADLLDRAATALRLSAGGGVPDGWKLVPIEPTSEMIGSGGLASFKSDMATGLNVREGLISTYKAMLAASPTAPAEGA